jgi:tripartite-type tricarboxylate transporter receptor subunit TctC
MNIRQCLASSLAVLAIASGGAALAQDAFPSKPVKLIVPYPPGQSADIIARLLADKLGKKWGQGVIVENKAGGNTIPGMVAGRDAPADGYTLTLASVGSFALNPSLVPKLPYDPVKDYALVSGLYLQPYIIIAGPAAQFDSMPTLIAALKANPAGLAWGATGIAQRVGIEWFKQAAGVNATAVPYTGSGPGLNDLLGGHVPILMDSLASALPHIMSGKVKPIAMTTSERVPQLPQVPTVMEHGLPTYSAVGWVGLVAPRNTPLPVVQKISADVREIIERPAMKNEILRRGSVPDPRGPQEWGAFVANEVEVWGGIIRSANIKAD